jgi:hypothetical protein
MAASRIVRSASLSSAVVAEHAIWVETNASPSRWNARRTSRPRVNLTRTHLRENETKWHYDRHYRRTQPPARPRELKHLFEQPASAGNAKRHTQIHWRKQRAMREPRSRRPLRGCSRTWRRFGAGPLYQSTLRNDLLQRILDNSPSKRKMIANI